MWYVYIIKCSDDTLYTGITTNIERRLSEHNDGDGAKYKKGRTLVELVYSEECKNRSEASIRESQVKSMRRDDKKQFVD